jgi:hypothetical protein
LPRLALAPRGVEDAAGQEAAHEDAAFADWSPVDDGHDRVGRVVTREVDAPRAAGTDGQKTVTSF